ncbi:MAG: hypothetical protein GY722_21055 [bacterium]|nr:hypothetical protein [bacterium]
MSEDFEELEQIPWAALAATPGDSRARTAAITIGVVVIGLIGWFAMRGSQPTVTLPGPVPTSTTVAVAQATAPLPAAFSAAPAPAPDPVPVYSEADLMLIDVEQEQRLAIMQAEWLVRDYLTIDGDPLVVERTEALSLDPPALDLAASYVEWVRAFSVKSPEPGRYRVEVLYRLLAEEEQGFVRRPASALAVEIAVDTDGSTRLLASPEPVPVPTLHGIEQ